MDRRGDDLHESGGRNSAGIRLVISAKHHRKITWRRPGMADINMIADDRTIAEFPTAGVDPSRDLREQINWKPDGRIRVIHPKRDNHGACHSAGHKFVAAD